jgi:hypothetical protein
MSDNQPVRLDQDKWIRTTKCGCGECRFKDLETRGPCPMENDPAAVYLWYLNPDMIGCKDYTESPDFSAPTAFTDKVEEVQEAVETDQESPS